MLKHMNGVNAYNMMWLVEKVDTEAVETTGEAMFRIAQGIVRAHKRTTSQTISAIDCWSCFNVLMLSANLSPHLREKSQTVFLP